MPEVTLRRTGVLFVASLVLFPASAFGQKEQTPAGASRERAPKELVVQDGGTRGVLESIVIPPKAGAPFTLTLETEWVKALFDAEPSRS